MQAAKPDLAAGVTEEEKDKGVHDIGFRNVSVTSHMHDGSYKHLKK